MVRGKKAEHELVQSRKKKERLSIPLTFFAKQVCKLRAPVQELKKLGFGKLGQFSAPVCMPTIETWFSEGGSEQQNWDTPCQMLCFAENTIVIVLSAKHNFTFKGGSVAQCPTWTPKQWVVFHLWQVALCLGCFETCFFIFF